MESSFISRLPPDLTHQLALRLPWRELYQAYINQPEYRRYDNPDHQLWKELFHRDLSSYLLPEGVSYRNQYFAGHDTIEKLRSNTKQLFQYLVEHGYDKALIEAIKDCLNESVPYDTLLMEATKMGDRKIAQILIKSYGQPDSPGEWGPDPIHDAITVALRKGYRDLVYYLYLALYEAYPNANSYFYHAGVIDFLSQALKGGDPELIAFIAEQYVNIGGSLTGFIEEELSPNVPVRGITALIELLPQDQQAGYAHLITRAAESAVRNCDTEYLNCAGIPLTSRDYRTLLTHCYDLELYDWNHLLKMDLITTDDIVDALGDRTTSISDNLSTITSLMDHLDKDQLKTLKYLSNNPTIGKYAKSKLKAKFKTTVKPKPRAVSRSPSRSPS